MDIIKHLETFVGGRWVGVAFHDHGPAEAGASEKPIRFCEAVAKSIAHPLTLWPTTLCCAGGLRSFGWSDRHQEDLAKAISEKSGMPADAAFQLVATTPVLRDAPKAITVGISTEPDVAISYGLPEAAMMLVRIVQEQTGANLSVEVSSVMSVCGNVAVRAHLTGRICISFGCMDSREATGMGRERLIVGVPKSAFGYFDAPNRNAREVATIS